LYAAIAELPLQVLDVSTNQLTHLPISLHTMTTLVDLSVDNNKLDVPPMDVRSRSVSVAEMNMNEFRELGPIARSMPACFVLIGLQFF
jgi:hypothetical protein